MARRRLYLHVASAWRSDNSTSDQSALCRPSHLWWTSRELLTQLLPAAITAIVSDCGGDRSETGVVQFRNAVQLDLLHLDLVLLWFVGSSGRFAPPTSSHHRRLASCCCLLTRCAHLLSLVAQLPLAVLLPGRLSTCFSSPSLFLWLESWRPCWPAEKHAMRGFKEMLWLLVKRQSASLLHKSNSTMLKVQAAQPPLCPFEDRRHRGLW